jgi:hypothetical protein
MQGETEFVRERGIARGSLRTTSPTAFSSVIARSLSSLSPFKIRSVRD